MTEPNSCVSRCDPMVRPQDRLDWDLMIGQFAFCASPSPDDVILEIAWDDAAATGRVISPAWVIGILRFNDVGVRRDDEFLALPIALSYAILVSAMAGAKLTLSGDFSAWPERWGILKDRCSNSKEHVISH